MTPTTTTESASDVETVAWKMTSGSMSRTHLTLDGETTLCGSDVPSSSVSRSDAGDCKHCERRLDDDLPRPVRAKIKLARSLRGSAGFTEIGDAIAYVERVAKTADPPGLYTADGDPKIRGTKRTMEEMIHVLTTRAESSAQEAERFAERGDDAAAERERHESEVARRALRALRERSADYVFEPDADDLEVQALAAGELYYYANSGGWDPELRFRERPFSRICRRLIVHAVRRPDLADESTPESDSA